jgi:Acyl-CoA dehydrogenase, C-terminal domain
MTVANTSIDQDTLDMLRGSLRHVLTDSSDQPLSDRLAELGWADVLADDPSTALRTLFEIKGDTLSAADALGPELTRMLVASTGDESLADCSVGLPSPFGPSALSGNALTVDTITLSDPAGIRIAVAAEGRLAIVPLAPLIVGTIGGFDEALGAHRITGTVPSADVRWLDGDVWQRLVGHGRWLLSCELVGIGRHVLASAVEYTGQRVQYGKPIGVFQALQHRVATAHSWVVGASHLATEAGDTGDAWTATVAKCMAGQAAESACTQAQQCYGAIGFTWEHEFHRYLRRTYSLDRLLGDWRTLEHEIGAALQATGTVPRIGSL